MCIREKWEGDAFKEILKGGDFLEEMILQGGQVVQP